MPDESVSLLLTEKHFQNKKTSESADKPFQNREQESIANGNGLVFLLFCGLDSIILAVQWYSLFP